MRGVGERETMHKPLHNAHFIALPLVSRTWYLANDRTDFGPPTPPARTIVATTIYYRISSISLSLVP